MCAVTTTQPFQGLRLLKTERVFPRVAKAQPWADLANAFSVTFKLHQHSGLLIPGSSRHENLSFDNHQS